MDGAQEPDGTAAPGARAIPATPATPAAAVAAVAAPSPRPEATVFLVGEARSAWLELARMRGTGERRAALLGLLLTPDSARERQAWREELDGLVTAPQVLALLQALPDAARLPVLERLLDLAGEDPLAERQALLVSARRVMCADGRVRPVDRLVWLLLRHRCRSAEPLHRGGLREANDLAGLPLAMRQAVARFTAYLARLVPQPARGVRVDAAGAAWYLAVVQSLWGQAPDLPPCQPPDVDGLGRALHTLGALTWMRRPLLARRWVEAAEPAWADLDPADRLAAAEALRLACGLLDTPLPPALARQFVEPPPAPTRPD